MKTIKFNVLEAQAFHNYQPPKMGINSIKGIKAFNGEVTGKITQKVEPSIGPIKKTISPTISDIPEVGINPKTEPFNGLVPGRTDSNINWKKIVIYSVSTLAIGVAGYFAYKKWKKKDEENKN
ncbi:MAG: hypothetical protein A3K10_09870 [Bacteroidetes bacterium RIFCSPLOWO2_12_FULL_31_6]|nr:MAG: hypothetical protein A3K10_09870 [Bacteroidetes bacterium RIFCSPLOWO2_12_FULL_31_6]